MYPDLERLKINYAIKNQNFYEEEFRMSNPLLSPEEVSYCIHYANNLRFSNLPVIYNLDHLSTLTGYSTKHLYFLVKNDDKVYRKFHVPKKLGGKRIILSPRKELKKIQRWLLDEILYNVHTHKSAKGFLKGTSIIDNAKEHVDKKIVLNIDIKDFFPSIKYRRVYGLFNSLGYTSALCRILTGLCTYKDFLPQGSPASPMISNLVCYKLDRRLSGFAEKNRFSYTRYADDITFSGDYKLVKCKDFIINIIQNEGFKISYEKLRVIGSGDSQKVTGLVVNEKVSFDRKKIRRLRAIVHNCKIKGPIEANKNGHPNFREHIYGYLAFLKPIKPDLSKKWKKVLDELDWDEYDEKYGVVIRDKQLKGIYKEKVRYKFWLDFRNISSFSEIVKIEDLSPEERKKLYRKLKNLKEKCNIDIEDKCLTCLTKVYGDEVHLCLKRIIGFFTGNTGGSHHGGELGDAWVSYPPGIGKERTKNKFVVFVMKSGKVAGKEKDTLLRQSVEYLNKDIVGAILIVSPAELDPNIIGYIADCAGNKNKQVGIITPQDLMCILKKYYEVHNIV